MATSLTPIVTARLDAEPKAWFELALERARSGDVTKSLALAPRRCGVAAIEPTAEESALLGEAGLAWAVAGATLDELARMVLFAAAPAAEGRAGEWFRLGDNREKRAVLRALPLLPAPERCLEVAIASCRTSVQTVFEAICCENPYPAAHFPEPAFNQMVLKALFTGAALARVIGLDDRNGAELKRMAAGYASERSAAGRSVPADIARILGDAS